MGLFSFLGFGSNIKNLIRSGAVIIDVRTVHEYDQGRIKGSLNIPLNRIPPSIERIKGLDKPIILVCNSGSRSGNAMRILKQNGLKEVYNGGNWESVLKKIISL